MTAGSSDVSNRRDGLATLPALKCDAYSGLLFVGTLYQIEEVSFYSVF